MSQRAIEEAKASGLLPHEWLLAVVRGEPIEQRRIEVTYDDQGNIEAEEVRSIEVFPTLSERIDAAKAVAPYYAPKLQAQTVEVSGHLNMDNLTEEEVDKKLAERLALIGK